MSANVKSGIVLWLSVISIAILYSPALAEDWSPLNTANSPSARRGHSMVDIAGKIYVFGGDDVAGM